MPKPVCVKCSREMTCVKAGAVEFHAIVHRGPYQQWQGDLYRCPTCGCEITTAYGGRASWEHFEGEEKRDHQPIAVAFERGVRP